MMKLFHQLLDHYEDDGMGHNTAHTKVKQSMIVQDT